MIIYIIYYGENHDTSIILSDLIKARFQLFRLTKTWRETGYPFMVEYEDENGIFKIRAHHIVNDRNIHHMSLQHVANHPEILQSNIQVFSNKEYSHNWWCFKGT